MEVPRELLNQGKGEILHANNLELLQPYCHAREACLSARTGGVFYH